MKMYPLGSGYATKFDSSFSWNFDDEFVRKIVIFRVDNSSSFHTDKRNNSLVLYESSNYGIHRNFGSQEKKFRKLILIKQIFILLELAL